MNGRGLVELMRRRAAWMRWVDAQIAVVAWLSEPPQSRVCWN